MEESTQKSKYESLNAQSVRNKVELMNDCIIEEDIDICFLTETWPTEHNNGIVT